MGKICFEEMIANGQSCVLSATTPWYSDLKEAVDKAELFANQVLRTREVTEASDFTFRVSQLIVSKVETIYYWSVVVTIHAERK